MQQKCYLLFQFAITNLNELEALKMEITLVIIIEAHTFNLNNTKFSQTEFSIQNAE